MYETVPWYLGYVNGIPMVTLKVHNQTKILVSKKERPIANPYDMIILICLLHDL